MGKKPTTHSTDYLGVIYIKSKRYNSKGEPIDKEKPSVEDKGKGHGNRVYYLRYPHPKNKKKQVEEKLGRHGERGDGSEAMPWLGDLTAAKARDVRTLKALGQLPTNTEAKDAKKAAEEAQANRMTMSKLWLRFKEVKEHNKSFRDDENRWNIHLKNKIGELLIEEVTHEKIQSIQNGLRSVKSKRSGEYLAQATQNHIVMLIKRMLNFADANDLGHVNGKASNFKLPKLNNRVTEALNPEQEKALLKAIDLTNVEKKNDYIPALMMQLAWYMGMRKGEIVKLKWNHIADDGFLLLEDPKGGEDVRIPILNPAPDIFKEARRVAEEQGVMDSPYVFPATSGPKKGGMRSDVTSNARLLRDAAGLDKDWRPFHGIRHCFGTRLANVDGISFDQVKELMTHKNPATTERYVSHKDKMKLRAAEVLNAQLELTEEDEAPDNSREGAA